MAKKRLTIEVRQRGGFGVRRVPVMAEMTMGGIVAALARALEVSVDRVLLRVARRSGTVGRIEAHLTHPSGELAIVASSPAITLPRAVEDQPFSDAVTSADTFLASEGTFSYGPADTSVALAVSEPPAAETRRAVKILTKTIRSGVSLPRPSHPGMLRAASVDEQAALELAMTALRRGIA